MNILIVGHQQYKNAFLHYDNEVYFQFAYMEELKAKSILDDIELVCFTGGEDVHPSLYGEEEHPTTHSNIIRDQYEANLFQRVLKAGIPMVGICRGSQFLTVMNGGKLIQDVTNHGISGTHKMTGVLPPPYPNGMTQRWEFPVTSTHHQMMYPFVLPNTDYKVVGWADSLSNQYNGVPVEELERKSFVGEDGEVKKQVVEPEVVLYPNTRCLAVQYHPEQMPIYSTGVQWFQSAIKDYLFS